MRSSRLLSLQLHLQLHGRTTAEALAREFEVSVRTIYRDIERLGAAGVPVCADLGPGGGYRLIDGYRTRLTGLTPAEAEALYMIGLPAAAEALGLGHAAADARSKMFAALPEERTALAGRLRERFHLDTASWYHADAPPAELPALVRAVLDQRTLEMTYESWTGVRDWRVRPLGLVLKAGDWYLVAQGHGKARTFKVANLRRLAVTEHRFERPADFALDAYWTESLARFETALRPGIAEIRLTATGLDRLARLGTYARAAAAAATSCDEAGWSRVALPIEHVEQAALLLLGLGPEVRVEAPEALRLRLRALAEAIAWQCEGDVR